MAGARAWRKCCDTRAGCANTRAPLRSRHASGSPPAQPRAPRHDAAAAPPQRLLPLIALAARSGCDRAESDRAESGEAGDPAAASAQPLGQAEALEGGRQPLGLEVLLRQPREDLAIGILGG